MSFRLFLAALGTAICAFALAPDARAENPQVAGLQVALRSKGLYRGPIDAIQGERTRTALRAFQRRAGLVPDGLAGRETRAALGRLGRPLYGTRNLHRGMVGWDVAVLQFLLARRDLAPGRLDGRFGPRTHAALVRFQRSARLRPDGVLGRGTGTALCLRALCAFRVPAPTRFTRYLVRPGDSLSGIAARYRLSLATIARANDLHAADLLLAGATLRIPLSAMCRGAKKAARHGRRSVRATLDYWAGHYGVDPHLVRALAWMESGYQQEVTSPAGAHGVMQITPAAWVYVESVLLGKGISHGVEGNIQIGVALLRHLLREHHLDPSRALAAYLQGDRSVRIQGLLPATRVYVADVLALATRL
jgi:LysM repeat protein